MNLQFSFKFASLTETYSVLIWDLGSFSPFVRVRISGFYIFRVFWFPFDTIKLLLISLFNRSFSSLGRFGMSVFWFKAFGPKLRLSESADVESCILEYSKAGYTDVICGTWPVFWTFLFSWRKRQALSVSVKKSTSFSSIKCFLFCLLLIILLVSSISLCLNI